MSGPRDSDGGPGVRRRRSGRSGKRTVGSGVLRNQVTVSLQSLLYEGTLEGKIHFLHLCRGTMGGGVNGPTGAPDAGPSTPDVLVTTFREAAGPQDRARDAVDTWQNGTRHSDGCEHSSEELWVIDQAALGEVRAELEDLYGPEWVVVALGGEPQAAAFYEAAATRRRLLLRNARKSVAQVSGTGVAM